MIILIVALAVGAVVGGISGYWLGVVGGILPGLAAAAAAYFLLGRAISKQLEQGMLVVQREIQKGPANVQRAIDLLEGMKQRFGKLQFFASSSIDGQIGTLYFMQSKFKEARPYLERAFVRLWHAKVMLAVLQYKKKDYAGMDETLERTAKYAPKQGLLWSTWAYMHWKAGNRDKAISILARGKEALGDSDALIASNLLALQNGNKMKMKGYGDAWYQFQLEQHPAVLKAQRGNMRFARR